MAYFRTCPNCGDNLDPGEKCECQAIKPKKTYKYISRRYFTKGLTFETQYDGTIVIKAGKRVIYGG